jgi:hypothetical protein
VFNPWLFYGLAQPSKRFQVIFFKPVVSCHILHLACGRRMRLVGGSTMRLKLREHVPNTRGLGALKLPGLEAALSDIWAEGVETQHRTHLKELITSSRDLPVSSGTKKNTLRSTAIQKAMKMKPTRVPRAVIMQGTE